VFLFAKARIAIGRAFPRDLHKISILEARPEKNNDESRGPDDESLLKPALLALTYSASQRRNRYFHGLVQFRGCVPYSLPRFISPFPSYIFDPPATSQFLSHLISINDLLSSLSSFFTHCFALVI
jgi:hypothetical protein